MFVNIEMWLCAGGPVAGVAPGSSQVYTNALLARLNCVLILMTQMQLIEIEMQWIDTCVAITMWLCAGGSMAGVAPGSTLAYSAVLLDWNTVTVHPKTCTRNPEP